MKQHQEQEEYGHVSRNEGTQEPVDGLGHGRMWTVSDMTDFVTCPEKVRIRHNLHRLGESNESLLIGQLEHTARRLLAKILSGVYITSGSKDEMISRAYPEIGKAVEISLEQVGPTDAARTEHFSEFVDELKSRLSREEDERILQASYLLRCGTTNVDIVRTLLPVRTEYTLASESSGYVGRIDAIFETPTSLIPVDYKTCGYQPGMDLSSWELQVAAYCRLLEEQYGVSVDYGMLYLTRTFTWIPVVLTEEKRAAIDEVLRKLAEFVRKADAPCRRPSSSCEYCPYSAYCASESDEPKSVESTCANPTATNTTSSTNVLDVIMNQTGTLRLFDGGVGDE